LEPFAKFCKIRLSVGFLYGTATLSL
jgi:hypothetical protein